LIFAHINDQEGAMQAVLHGTAASLVVIEILLELETKVPFELPG
jgi:hypothetical protein